MFAAYYIYNTPFVIDSEQKVHQIFASQEQKEALNSFIADEYRANQGSTLVRSHTIKEDLLTFEETEIVKQIVTGFKGARSFVISEHKLILWSKYNIMHGTLVEMKKEDDSILKESGF